MTVGAPVLHLRGPVLVGPDDVRDQAWVVGGRLTFTRPGSGAASTTLAGWVVPGLVDAHCHVGLGPEGVVDEATAERQALTDRDAGALLLRDAGSPADTRWIDHRADLPVLIRAGRHIARPRRYVRNFAEEVEPDELVDTVRRQAARGDGWVKLVGDWIDRASGDLAPCWPQPELQQAIAAAHDLGARVTAHCFGADCLRDLLDAGIDCVEHATGLDPTTAAVFARRGVAIVPTLVNIATFPAIADSAQEKFPRYARHMRDLHRRRYDTVRAAHEAGVSVFAGTDAGGSLAHGLIAHEVSQLAAAGLPPVRALDAACWGARSWLGQAGLSEGAPADLLVCREDPRVDLNTLRAPAQVVLRGAVRSRA
ncbi:MAG TPA: amidohydrolase family protein [Mycobacteriales bacterium]|nr:amidohydrolase family protein [Mycobacteriales bacterium]